MNSITIIKDETHNKRYAQIDLNAISKYTNQKMQDLFDVLVAESRKDDDKISLKKMESLLKKANKFK
jgi:hypothetical protein